VRLARAPWSQLHRVVVRHNERDHPSQEHVLLARGEPVGFEADAAQQQGAPLLEGELGTTRYEGLEGIPGRHLDRSHRLDPEGLTARLLAESSDVLKGDLRVEPPGQHPVVLGDQVLRDVDVGELDARELRLVGVRLGVEARAEQIDDFDAALLAGARLEQLLFACPHRTFLHRALDDPQALGDLLGISGGAESAQ